MDTEAGIDEFVGMMRLGTAALKQIISKDHELTPELKPDINEVLYLIDRLHEISEQIFSKNRSKTSQSSSM